MFESFLSNLSFLIIFNANVYKDKWEKRIYIKHVLINKKSKISARSMQKQVSNTISN